MGVAVKKPLIGKTKVRCHTWIAHRSVMRRAVALLSRQMAGMRNQVNMDHVGSSKILAKMK